MTKNKIVLWYDHDAEEAARFYAETFPQSSLDAIHRAPADYPGGKSGDALTVDFTVAGIPCIGLNGGPQFIERGSTSLLVYRAVVGVAGVYKISLVTRLFLAKEPLLRCGSRLSRAPSGGGVIRARRSNQPWRSDCSEKLSHFRVWTRLSTLSKRGSRWTQIQGTQVLRVSGNAHLAGACRV